jgi:hypothetical protein
VPSAKSTIGKLVNFLFEGGIIVWKTYRETRKFLVGGRNHGVEEN